MAGKSTGGEVAAPHSTDLTSILARLDALEAAIKEITSATTKLADLGGEVAKASAPRDEFDALAMSVEELSKTVAGHTETLANETARLLNGELASAELVEDYDARDEVLKVHRAVEAIANHLNFRLPG
jgi:hypothetical protein